MSDPPTITTTTPTTTLAMPVESLIHLSLLCRVIGDAGESAIRARILWLLHTHGPLDATQLCPLLDNIPHPTLSMHLKKLETVSLILSQRVGSHKVKTLNRETIHNLSTSLN